MSTQTHPHQTHARPHEAHSHPHEAHSHPHEAHSHPHEAQPRHDVLVLDIGGDVGALMILTGPGLDEAEIEISPGDDPTAHRVHNQVHARHDGLRVAYTAVFPGIRAGDYTVWHPDGSPYAHITVRGGEVTTLTGWA